MDAGSGDVSAVKLSPEAQAVLAIAGVVLCTKAFGSAARSLGWNTQAIAAGLYVAGHLATKL
jgi:hypothetical protein